MPQEREMEDDRHYPEGHPYAGWVTPKYVNIFTYEGRLYNLEMTSGPLVAAFAANLIRSLRPQIENRTDEMWEKGKTYKERYRARQKAQEIATAVITETFGAHSEGEQVLGSPQDNDHPFWYSTLQLLIAEYILDTIISPKTENDPARGPFKEDYYKLLADFPKLIETQVAN